MATKHTHAFTRSKPSATVETCDCGKFRHTENAGHAIVEQRAEYSPAPWTAYDNDGYSIWRVRSGERLIAEVIGDSAETEANARLISASAELLAALKAMHKMFITEAGYLPDDSEFCAIENASMAAIAKAEGQDINVLRRAMEAK